MVSKFEAIGIAVSILAMAGALFLIRHQAGVVAEVASKQETQLAAIVVNENEPEETALRKALLEGSDVTGAMTRLVVDDVVVGIGPEVKSGDTVSVHYIGTLPNGQQFDESYQRGEPFTFTVGEGKVIKGWEQGILGMKEGGHRILVVPPDLAYGDGGFGPIPGKATLVFSVELLSINE